MWLTITMPFISTDTGLFFSQPQDIRNNAASFITYKIQCALAGRNLVSVRAHSIPRCHHDQRKSASSPLWPWPQHGPTKGQKGWDWLALHARGPLVWSWGRVSPSRKEYTPLPCRWSRGGGSLPDLGAARWLCKHTSSKRAVFQAGRGPRPNPAPRTIRGSVPHTAAVHPPKTIFSFAPADRLLFAFFS